MKSNVEFEVHANVDWIEQIETKALSSNTISMRISASDMFENRVGTITISQNSGSLSVNINVSQEAAKPKEITLNNAGELASLLGDKYLTIIGLKLNGNLNGSDFLLIRRMEKLKYLDLSEARIVAGGVDYYTFDQYQHYATDDDVIGDYMFAYLPLEQMILPKVISKIGERAFYQSKLKTISPIPGNVELSEEIFMYCYSLTSIEFGEGISFFPTWLLGYCRNLVSISLPSTLKDLGPACLNGTALSSIVLPDGLMKIQSSALSSPNITELVIPQNVEFIGDWAFDTCSNLKEIHIKSMPSTLTYVGNKIADYNNVTVYIPKGTYSVYFLTNLGNFKNLIEE